MLLVRTPYGKDKTLLPKLKPFVEEGYAVVIQDVPGRYDSQGVFDPLRQEPQDGDDTLHWIAKQPWSNGRVGTVGGAYLGIVQWKAALTGNRI
ncbi:MAG: CocE/NonD family hydrolase [Bryobacterales bacterium]|nr:CocE/NonD family hydrolase [Bryobacterales bacterium]